MFTGISVSLSVILHCKGPGTYVVLFKQDTCIDSPGLYPRASFKLLIGCWPVTATERETQNEPSAARGSQNREIILNDTRREIRTGKWRKALLEHFLDCRNK